MAKPTQEHEDLLRRHRFALVSENKHRKYKDPEGRVYIVSKTPSDWRAWRNALTTLKRVIASPVPTSEVIEEERQRRELEAFIVLEAQRKPCGIGISGAGKGKKSKGCGIYYEEKKPTPAPVIVKRELTPEEVAHLKELEAQKEARRALSWAEEEWRRQLRQFRRDVQQVQKDINEIQSFNSVAVLFALTRKQAAMEMREWRKQSGGAMQAEQRKRLFDVLFLMNFMEAFNQDGNFRAAVLYQGAEDTEENGQLLLCWGGRRPRFLGDLSEGLYMTAAQIRIVRRLIEYLNGEPIEVEDVGRLKKKRPPEWLCDAAMRLRVGENKYEPEGD